MTLTDIYVCLAVYDHAIFKDYPYVCNTKMDTALATNRGNIYLGSHSQLEATTRSTNLMGGKFILVRAPRILVSLIRAIPSETELAAVLNTYPLTILKEEIFQCLVAQKSS